MEYFIYRLKGQNHLSGLNNNIISKVGWVWSSGWMWSWLQDYVHLDDQTQPTFEMTPGFKPFTIILLFFTRYLMQLPWAGQHGSKDLLFAFVLVWCSPFWYVKEGRNKFQLYIHCRQNKGNCFSLADQGACGFNFIRIKPGQATPTNSTDFENWSHWMCLISASLLHLSMHNAVVSKQAVNRQCSAGYLIICRRLL